MMKLKTSKRDDSRKCNAKVLRRQGSIPCVIYGSDGKTQSIAIEKGELEAHLRKMEKGHLATTVFTLEGDVKGKAIVKDIQYQPTSYDILHLDFGLLKDDVHVNVNVPIHYTGVNDCVGIKLGGFLRQVIRALRVNCLPKDIPAELRLDVAGLGIQQTLRLRDIVIPKGVTPKGKMDEVAVVIAKR